MLTWRVFAELVTNDINALFSPYVIDSSVQLVCKYLLAYKNRADTSRGINRLYVDKGECFTYYKHL